MTSTEGQALSVRLKQAGVTVDAQDYEGVTHEFFGMGLVSARPDRLRTLRPKT